MDKPAVVGIRKEDPSETALRLWFERQTVSSTDTLEAAARQLVGLTSTLLGLLLGVLAIAADPLPNYLSLPLVRWLGVAVVVLLLGSLMAALRVVLPRRWQAASSDPGLQKQVFSAILERKSRALTWAVYAFGLATTGLGLVIVVALLTAR